jgi:hypothetical protein
MSSREISTTLYVLDGAYKKLERAWQRLEDENPSMQIGFGNSGTNHVPAWVNVISVGLGYTPSHDKHIQDVNAIIDEIGRNSVIEVAPRRRGVKL